VVERAVVEAVDVLPRGAGVLRAVDAGAELRHVAVIGAVALGLEAVLDDGDEDARIAARDGQPDAAGLTRRQPVRELRPALAAIRAPEDAAVGSAAHERM